MGYPARGVVLDRLRGIVPDELLKEVQSIQLPPGHDWTEFEWLKKVHATVNEWELMGKLPVRPLAKAHPPPGNHLTKGKGP